MLGLRAASFAARLGFFEGAPALRARDSFGHAPRARVRCWHLLFLSRLGAAGSVGEQVLRGADTAPLQAFALDEQYELLTAAPDSEKSLADEFGGHQLPVQHRARFSLCRRDLSHPCARSRLQALAYYVRAVPRTLTDRALRARVSC